MKKDRRDHKGLFILAALSLTVICWSWLLNSVSPAEIVEAIGVRNGYFVMFLVALFGGVSSFSGVSYVATVLTLSAGGLNPMFLALASGAGISISDSVFYWIGLHSHHIVTSPKLQSLIERASTWLDNRSRLVVGFLIYMYSGFTPLPTDLITILLGLTRQPYLFVIFVLTLGNFTFSFLLATLGSNFMVF